jgi:hypothetical protein
MLAIVGAAFAFALHLAHATAGGLLILGLWLGDFLGESGRLRHAASCREHTIKTAVPLKW